MRLIDADALIFHVFKKHGLTEIILDIDEAPTVDAEPVRHGKWIYTGFMEVKCSNCGNVFHELEDTNYCPHCGYKMDMDEVNNETN